MCAYKHDKSLVSPFVTTHRELDESRRKEIRLREKLKDLTGGEGEHGGGAEAYKERAEVAERELALLRAQNLALRRGESGHGAGAGSKQRGDSGDATTRDEGVEVGEGLEKDGLRAQLHAKWESEKKLQKRLVVGRITIGNRV